MDGGITHSPIDPFGIAITADLGPGLSDTEKDTLRRLYQRDGIIVIPGQDLTMARQMEACRIFGPVLASDPREMYVVSNTQADGLLGNRELLFHNDVPFVPAPYLGGSLHALRADPGVSPTSFASAFLAYERLPAALRGRIDGLRTLQVRERADGRRTRLSDAHPGDNCAVHALVGRQAGTDRPYIFANMNMTACIIGMPEPDSDDLLEELFSYLYDPAYLYEHEWTRGDLVIWDNLAVQHARREIGGGERSLQRVTIAKFGYWEQVPADASYEDLRTVRPEPALVD